MTSDPLRAMVDACDDVLRVARMGRALMPIESSARDLAARIDAYSSLPIHDLVVHCLLDGPCVTAAVHARLMDRLAISLVRRNRVARFARGCAKQPADHPSLRDVSLALQALQESHAVTRTGRLRPTWSLPAAP